MTKDVLIGALICRNAGNLADAAEIPINPTVAPAIPPLIAPLAVALNTNIQHGRKGHKTIDVGDTYLKCASCSSFVSDVIFSNWVSI